jgi:hypothetical protein
MTIQLTNYITNHLTKYECCTKNQINILIIFVTRNASNAGSASNKLYVIQHVYYDLLRSMVYMDNQEVYVDLCTGMSDIVTNSGGQYVIS